MKIGDRVVCIDNSGAPELKKQNIYTLEDVWQNKAGMAVALTEQEAPRGYIGCFAYRFQPLPDNFAEETLEKATKQQKDYEIVHI